MHLVDQLFNSSEKRLARLLLLVANFGKAGPPKAIIAKVNQETLAEMVGTTRKLGFIDYNGHLQIHNSLLNVILHDEPSLNRSDEAGRRRRPCGGQSLCNHFRAYNRRLCRAVPASSWRWVRRPAAVATHVFRWAQQARAFVGPGRDPGRP